MRRALVIIGAILLVALTAATCFSEAEPDTDVAYIGKVRTLKDAFGRETDYFIRITTDSIAKEKIAKAQAGVRGQIEKYLALLEKEDDPDIRRHYLYRIGAASGLEALTAIGKLKQWFEREPEEDVRVAAISCLATLVSNASLADNHIIAVIDFIGARGHSDPSPNVRLGAANTLSWFGSKDDVLTIIRKSLPAKDHVQPVILDGLPATLQRIDNREATELLRQMTSDFDGDYVATDALRRLQQMGLVGIDAVIESSKNIAHKSPQEKGRIRAIYLMGTIARENPSKAGKITEIIKSIENQKDKELQRAIDSTLEEMGVTAAPAEPSAVEYDRQAVYAYAQLWWDGANHACGDYSACTPWSYWGRDVCGYSSHEGDCANFVSQSILAGGHPDLNTDGEWCRGYPCGREEIAARRLGECLVIKGWKRTCGYKISPPEGMKRGDVLIYHSGSCDSWSAHATVVVNADGSDVRIAGHSAPQWDKPYTYMQDDMPYYEFLQHPGDDDVGVSRNHVLMDTDFDATHEIRQVYGRGDDEDQYLVGDWDGDGLDNLAVRRGNKILMDYDFDGYADFTQSYGRGNEEDDYLVGDWDGDGRDNIAVRRGNKIYMDTDFDNIHNIYQSYGRGNDEDEYLVGDWDGDGRDNIGVRRGNKVYMDTDFDNIHNIGQSYGKGNDEDQYLVGDWDRDGRSNLAVRRGNKIYMDTDFDGTHNILQGYGKGNLEAEYLSGDWDGDGRSNVAVRRAP